MGLVGGACLADVGNSVICVDKDAAKISSLKDGEVPIYEPGLGEIIQRNFRLGRIEFTTDLKEAIQGADVCFITVNTPTGVDGRSDTRNVMDVAESIGAYLTHPTIVATKSTVPVGTTRKVGEVIARAISKRGAHPSILSLAFNPEFLKEGDAVNDFMKPDRVIVGVEDDGTAKKLHELYAPFMRRTDRFISMSIESAELTKYAANAMLATRISFMNEFARLSELTGADIDEVRKGLGSDPRIGPDFLYTGLGFGGSCLPKDSQAIVSLASEKGTRLTLIEAVVGANRLQREWFFEKIVCHFGGAANLKDRMFALFGLSFKANTDDTRYAPSLYIVERLLSAGARVCAVDPIVGEAIKGKINLDADQKNNLMFAKNIYDAAEGADAVVVCTESREFRSPDFCRIKSEMKTPVIFDGRNLYDPKALTELGFKYYGVGRKVGDKGLGIRDWENVNER